MIIENQDALKSWLGKTLEKLCEADPVALSKYVVALVKKDKPIEELKESVVDQMEVFLQNETKEFVNLLFETLETKSYTKESLPTEEVSEETAEVVKDDIDEVKTAKPAEASPSKEHRPSKRFEEEPRAVRRRSPLRRRDSPPPRHRRSPVSSRRFRSRSRSPGFRRGGSPLSRRRRSSPHRRSRSRSFSPHARKLHSRGSTPTKDEEAGYIPTSKSEKRPRCRDYDEKGYCLQGDQCKFDHGLDAVVLEEGLVPPYQPAAVPAASAIFTEPYVPASTAMSLPPMHIPPPGFLQEKSGLTTRKRALHELTEHSAYPAKRRFDYNRLGRGRGGGRGGRSNLGGGAGNLTSQIAVRNIPPPLNTIAHLNNHFTRFGTLTNIQVHFEGDPASALVSFSTPTEAELAMKSSDAVLGNRFIKVFYHTEKKEALKPGVVAEGGNIVKTIVNDEAQAKNGSKSAKEESKAAEISAIRKNQEALEAKAKLKRTSEDAREKVKSLIKGKQELLDKLIEEQKKLLGKLEEKKSTLKAEERSQFLAILKSLTASIDTARDDLKQLVQSLNRKRTLSDVQKDLLDAELELFTAQQNGAEVVDIQKRVNQLRIEAAKVGVLPTSKAPRGRGSPYFRGASRFPRMRGRGRGRFAGPGVTSVDRRPSKILASGFELDEKEALIEHFASFGEIVDNMFEDESVPSIIIHFKTRQYAEAAMSAGKTFGDRTLQLTWYTASTPSDFHAVLQTEHDNSTHEEEADDDYTPPDPTYLPPGLEDLDKSDAADSNKDGNDDSLDEFGTEDLLAEDLLAEDDDEESEERSWKR